MTKSSIINQVAKELGTTAAKAKPLVEAVFETLKETLESGEGVRRGEFRRGSTDKKVLDL